MSISRRVVLHFPRSLLDQPVVYRLVKDYNLVFNILKASVTPEEEGLVVLELTGDELDYDRGLKYLSEAGVEVQPLSRDVVRDEERCAHCGACAGFCPGGALEMDLSTMRVDFHDDKCIACGLCIRACPLRAMAMSL
jgi:ferredoxin